MSVDEQIQREKQASKNLTEYMAKQEINDDYVGETGEATIVDVMTEFEGEDGLLVQFEVQLPDNSVGYLRFTSYRDGLLEQFLREELNTSYTEMNVLMEKFTVVKTSHKWRAIIGKSPFRFLYEEKDSLLFEIGSRGLPILNNYISYSILMLYITLVVAQFVFFGVQSALVFGGITCALLILAHLFIYIPVMTMISPSNVDIQNSSVRD